MLSNRAVMSLLFASTLSLAQSQLGISKAQPAPYDLLQGAPEAVNLELPSGKALHQRKESDPKTTTAAAAYSNLPLAFEANQGQTDQRVKFVSRAPGYTLFVTSDEAVFSFASAKTKYSKLGFEPRLRSSRQRRATTTRGAVLRVKLRNANPSASLTGADEMEGVANYFIGNASARWRTNVRTYAKVKYKDIYPDIDLVYYGNHREVEYDFIVGPGADPHLIDFEVLGAKGISHEKNGDLALEVPEGRILWKRPFVYQDQAGKKQIVAGRYVIKNGRRIGFEVAHYDSRKPLIIDPAVVYSTYLGGSASDAGAAIAVDASGSAYVVGRTASIDFPVTGGVFQAACSGGCAHTSAFVAKLNVAGSALVYSTYLGGSGGANGGDVGTGIAVDASGDAYVTGTTYSEDFPTTPGAFRTVCDVTNASNCGTNPDGFVAKLNSTGSALSYSTYLGGSNADVSTGIAVDASGDAFVTGATTSADFPTTAGAFRTICPNSCTNYHASITELNPTGSALIYSTYLGGSTFDSAQAIAVDSSGDAFVAGETCSTDFPVTQGAFQTSYGGGGCDLGDGFVTKLNSSGSALVYSTYLGGNDVDGAFDLVIDTTGDAFVTGATSSTNFPTTPGAFQTMCGGGCASELSHGFVTELNATGSGLVYSTYLGGSNDDEGVGIAVDASGNAYVAGITTSSNFPVTSNAIQATCGGTEGNCANAFVAEFNAAGSLIFSSYFGGSGVGAAGSGIAVDTSGIAYVTGLTASNFPISNSLQPKFGGGAQDAFVMKLSPLGAVRVSLQSSLNPAPLAQPVNFTATVIAQGLGTPTGTVTFYDGTVSLGSAPLTDNAATLTVSNLATGAHTIAAVYSGDSNFMTGTSAVLVQSIQDTATSLISSLNPASLGQSVLLTASVTSLSGGLPTGTITFLQNGKYNLGTSPLNAGRATLNYAFAVPGTRSIVAIYSGDANFTTSSSPALIEVVGKIATTTSLTSSPNPSAVAQSVTLNATVTGQYGIVPTGTVTFEFGYGGILGTVTLNHGMASLNWVFYDSPKQPLLAIYSGDGSSTTSTSSLTQTVQ